MERVNASLCGHHAVKALMAGERNKMVGTINNKIVLTPFEKAVKHHEGLDSDLEQLIQILSA
jgi:6-phosphofructokinase 1